jgi:hypothetical protein
MADFKPACAVNPLDHYLNTLFPCPHSFANHLPFVMRVWQGNVGKGMNGRFQTGLRREPLGSLPKYLIPLPHSFANHLPFVMRVWQGNVGNGMNDRFQNRLAP